MSRDTHPPDAAGDRLRALIQRAGLTMRQLSKRAGYSFGSGVQRHVESKAQHLPLEVAARLADAMAGLGSPPLSHQEIMRVLTGRDIQTSAPVRTRSSTQIPVIGVVEAGSWRPTLEIDDKPLVPWVAPPAFRTYSVVAFELRGHSMDRVYPHGSIILAVTYVELGREPRPGERVIVQRYAHDEVEATCKQLRVGSTGQLELWPESTRPEHQAPLVLPAVAGERVSITHRVIGAIVHEPL